MRDLNLIRAESTGVVEVTARCAFPINDQVRKDISDLAKKLYPAFSELILHEVHDDSVIGGVNLDFPGLNVDLTLRRRLNKLKELAT